MKKVRAFDVFGNVAIAKFPRDFKVADKKKFANKILKDNNPIKTVLEKVGKFSGRLRKMQTKYIAGEKTKEV
jgi:tRNA G37 N-methylase Trm5